MKEIGGYFELELQRRNNEFPHANCPAFNSGRHALEFILRQLGDKVKTVYIPYFTCDVIIEPLQRLGIEYKFYHINENLEIANIPNLNKNEYLIANNYFGIKDSYAEVLFQKLGSKLIIDNAQALFAPEITGAKAIYSPRKFVGVPDGGIAYTTEERKYKLEQDYSTDRSLFLLRRIDCGPESGYREFRENSQVLSVSPMKSMSFLTKKILQSIDFDEILKIRRNNFRYVHRELGHVNNLNIPDMSEFICPMVYPYRTSDALLRDKLIENKVFVATYWPNVREWCDNSDIEYRLMNEIIPIPIDQRYDFDDMDRICSLIQ